MLQAITTAVHALPYRVKGILRIDVASDRLEDAERRASQTSALVDDLETSTTELRQTMQETGFFLGDAYTIRREKGARRERQPEGYRP